MREQGSGAIVNNPSIARLIGIASNREDLHTLENGSADSRSCRSWLKRRDVKKLIEDKAKGQKRQAPPPKPARSTVIDLVAALQESLAQKKPRKRGAA
jgi:hypothetical protein